MKLRLAALSIFLSGLVASAGVAASAQQVVVPRPATPALTMQLDAGFSLEAARVRDADGRERAFDLLVFPARLRRPEIYLVAVREGLVSLFGCEAFAGCDPAITTAPYPTQPLLVVDSVALDGARLYLFPLVAPPDLKTPTGVAFVTVPDRHR